MKFITEIQVDDEWYTVQQYGCTTALTLFVCTKCEEITTTNEAAERHSITHHGRPGLLGVQPIAEYLTAYMGEVSMVEETIRESYIMLRLGGNPLPCNRDYDWRSILIASPISGEWTTGYNIVELVMRELGQRNIQWNPREIPNPFAFCKKLTSKAHKKLLRTHKLPGNVAYVEIDDTES